MTPDEIRRAERLRDEAKRNREFAEWRKVWENELNRRRK